MINAYDHEILQYQLSFIILKVQFYSTKVQFCTSESSILYYEKIQLMIRKFNFIIRKARFHNTLFLYHYFIFHEFMHKITIQLNKSKCYELSYNKSHHPIERKSKNPINIKDLYCSVFINGLCL